MKPCRWFHRWSRWTYEYEEMPDGARGTWEIRKRRCVRRRCDYIEEGYRCVSSSSAHASGRTP